MKKIIMVFVAVLMMAGFTMKVMAQTSAAVTGTTAGAKLVVPMGLTQTGVLHFGTINILTGAGGTVTLPASSLTRAFSSGVSESLVAPLATHASYNVTGTKNVTYALTLPPTITVTETLLSVATMSIVPTARFNKAVADAITSTLSETGTDNFTVGGVLTVGASAVGGIYAGTFDVSVDYN